MKYQPAAYRLPGSDIFPATAQPYSDKLVNTILVSVERHLYPLSAIALNFPLESGNRWLDPVIWGWLSLLAEQTEWMEKTAEIEEPTVCHIQQ